MRRRLSAALGVLALTGFGLAVAESGDAPPAYSLSSEVQVNGNVAAVQQHAGWMGWDGIYLTLRTNDATYEVHVGPASFLKMLDVSLVERDNLELKGSFVTIGGTKVLLVRELRKERVVVNLRDGKGRPVW